MEVIYHPKADDEVLESARFYEQRSEGALILRGDSCGQEVQLMVTSPSNRPSDPTLHSIHVVDLTTVPREFREAALRDALELE